MTAGVATVPPAADGIGARLRAIPFRPIEGWLSLVATAIMVSVLPLSLIDANWTLGSAGDSGFLPYVGFLGLAFGVLGAKIGWGRWRTHLVGALFAGVLLPLIVGGIVLGGRVGWSPPELAMRMAAALGVVQQVWKDLVIDGRPTTFQWMHYHLVFGALVWGAGQLAGFTVFGHRRPLDAVVVLGLAVIANMALTTHDQLGYLVLFSAGALLLLIRTHVFEEEVTWARRRIGDPAAVGQLYLRGGAAFVIAAVLGSILLTRTAASAPLQGLWEDLPRHLQGLAEIVQKIAPRGGDTHPLGIVGFGSSATTGGLWQPSNRTAFTAQVGRFELREVKWRAGTYSTYTTYGWEWGPVRREPTAARDILLGQFTAGDAPSPIGRRPFLARITPDAFRDRTVIAPNAVQWIDRPAEAIVTGTGGWFSSVELAEDADTYNLSALIPVLEDVQGGITEARLRQAGTDYEALSPELLALYTALPEGALGPAATQLLEDIRAAVNPPDDVDPDNAYDLVRTMERYFQDEDNFRYHNDVREAVSQRCGSASTAECFAIIRTGYCEYYATTMTVLLREADIPARIAYGFLPGARGDDGVETVAASSAHWWVEVYFPGSGWVEFDPTGGGVGQPQPIPSGSVGPPTQRPSRAPATFPNEGTERPVGPNSPGGPNASGSGIGPFIAIALILAIVVGVLAFTAYKRTPSKPMHPDQAWGSLARLASRFGLGPRPSQTVYEYAGALGDAVPDARVELTTIARAKVQVAYGKRDLGGDRLKRIAEAYHRLRFALLGVVLRRGFRRGKR
jgi:transglutaminase-like putative cysteine protease